MTIGKQASRRCPELDKHVEDGIIVGYEVRVTSTVRVCYSLISELRPDTTYPNNATTTFETSNARRPTISEHAVALLFEETIDMSTSRNTTKTPA
jgi:hypothetical protein